MGDYVTVSSSVIAAVVYDATWALNVQFHSGAEYQYPWRKMQL